MTVRALLAFSASLFVLPPSAAGLDGTWAGPAGSAQVIVAGGDVIGFFWRGDYRNVTSSAQSPSGLQFSFAGGTGVIRAKGAGATLTVTAGGRSSSTALKKD